MYGLAVFRMIEEMMLTKNSARRYLRMGSLIIHVVCRYRSVNGEPHGGEGEKAIECGIE
jgi:hypothetical protein